MPVPQSHGRAVAHLVPGAFPGRGGHGGGGTDVRAARAPGLVRPGEWGGGARVGGGQVQRADVDRLAGGQRHDEPVSGSRTTRAHPWSHAGPGPGATAAATRPGDATGPRPGAHPSAPASGSRPAADAAAPRAGAAADAAASRPRPPAAARSAGAVPVADSAGTRTRAEPGAGTTAHLRGRPRAGRGGDYAVTSDRSPPHSVWNAPSRSVLRYVCAPKKSRCPWVSAAGSRSARRAS